MDIDEHVAALEIALDDILLLVDVVDASRNVGRELHHHVNGHLDLVLFFLVLEKLVHVAVYAVLEDEAASIDGLRARAEEHDDVGVVKVGHKSDFKQKAFDELFVPRHRRDHRLDRDGRA